MNMWTKIILNCSMMSEHCSHHWQLEIYCVLNTPAACTICRLVFPELYKNPRLGNLALKMLHMDFFQTWRTVFASWIGSGEPTFIFHTRSTMLNTTKTFKRALLKNCELMFYHDISAISQHPSFNVLQLLSAFSVSHRLLDLHFACYILWLPENRSIAGSMNGFGFQLLYEIEKRNQHLKTFEDCTVISPVALATVLAAVAAGITEGSKVQRCFILERFKNWWGRLHLQKPWTCDRFPVRCAVCVNLSLVSSERVFSYIHFHLSFCFVQGTR